MPFLIFFVKTKLLTYFHCIARDGIIMFRRLIPLICSDWVPYDLVSSWSFLCLVAGVSANAYSNRRLEDSPYRDRAPDYAMKVMS